MSKKAKQISTYVIIALGASVVLGGIFTVMFMQTFAKANVIVAAKDIVPYSGKIKQEDFTTIEIAKGDVKNFTGFVANMDDLIGKVATTAIYKGQPVKSMQFVNPEDAVSLQNIVTSEGNRGLYFNMTAANALLGDMKVGGEYDFYVVTEKKNALLGDGEKEVVIIPLQASYKVNRIYNSEDNSSVSVFIEFPEEESERYVMLKQLITEGKANLIATMPNAIHNDYFANTLTETDFIGAMLDNKGYFTSINVKEQSDVDTEITTNNDVDKNGEANNEDKKDTVNNEDKKDTTNDIEKKN